MELYARTPLKKTKAIENLPRGIKVVPLQERDSEKSNLKPLLRL